MLSEPFIELSPLKLFLNTDKVINLLKLASNDISVDLTQPISVELHLTNRCNLKCRWCVDSEIRKDLGDLSYQVITGFFDEIAYKNIGVTLEGGGEPTIYPFFESVVYDAVKKNIPLGLISNGVKSFTPKLIKCFKWIRISVDASNAKEYQDLKGFNCFEEVMKNIRNICNNNISSLIGVGYVLTKYNYKNITSFLLTLQDIGVDYVQIKTVEECAHLCLSDEIINIVKENIEKMNSLLSFRVIINKYKYNGRTDNNNLPCIAHSIRSIIHADGKVYLCEKRRHDPVVLGSLYNTRFMELWYSKNRKEASKKLLDKNSQVGCEVCRITNYNKLFSDLVDLKTQSFI